MRSLALLVADDEESFRQLLVQRLTRKGYQVTAVPDGTAALAALEATEFDAAICDLKMPGATGIDVLKRAREVQSALPVLILTGHGSIDSAIEAIRAGAYDYLTKPCNLTELELILQRALERKALEVENRGLREALKRRDSQHEIVGQSPALARLMKLVERVAAADTPALIEGESGTGKELVARAVHAMSPRAGGPFLPVNCGALPAALLESELFGHARGAFTGAVRAKPGLVEVAERGTLFLDEIGEMPLDVQAKLLRFLESRESRRVGETTLRRIDVRVVAATNRHLADEVREGRFREDLYYRLNVVAMTVPPLRERREDIPLLVRHTLNRLGPQKELTPEATEALQRHPFPGNVRELVNLVQRGVVLSPDRYITPEDLGILAEGRPAGQPAVESAILSLEEMERRHIAAALAHTGWNRAQAAQLLGISVRNLYRKIEDYGLEPQA